jgi:ADP-heptose:LPS heptosyltransferase
MQKLGSRRPTMVILRALALGDFLTALPALRALRAHFPSHEVYLTSPRWLIPLIRFTGVVDHFIDGAVTPSRSESGGTLWVPQDPRDRIPLEKAQLGGLVGAPIEPDLAVNLRGVREELHRVLLTLRPRRLIAFRNAAVQETSSGPEWRSNEHEIDRWCRLLIESGIQADPRDLHISVPDSDVPEIARGATLIHPGAGSPARCWPSERWAAVARWEAQQGRSVILTGGPDEVNLASRVAEIAGLSEECVLAGKTDPFQLAAVVQAAERVICSDTGLVHLAVAVKTPSVVLFGPTPPSRWGPPEHLRCHRVLWAGVEGEPYAEKPDQGLLLISVEEVIEAVRGLEGVL